MPSTSPRLWIVATPIGNPDDLSPRAIKTLSSVDLALVEDKRRAARLFRECGIPHVRLASFFEHNEDEKLDEVLRSLREGAAIALVSDAGTPLLSDPGYRLVRACRKEGIPVSPLPGPSAPLAALSAAGIPPLPFSFLGFLPRQASGVKEIFTAFANVPGSLVFFERKDRLVSSLEIALPILGDREMAICRELTKIHEEFILGRLENYRELCANLLGEITLVIGPRESESRTPQNRVEAILREEMANGLKNRQAAASARRKCRGWSGGEIYDLLSALKKAEE